MHVDTVKELLALGATPSEHDHVYAASGGLVSVSFGCPGQEVPVITLHLSGRVFVARPNVEGVPFMDVARVYRRAAEFVANAGLKEP